METTAAVFLHNQPHRLYCGHGKLKCGSTYCGRDHIGRTWLSHGLGGAPKIVEINNAQTGAINYVQLVALIDARFANTNPRIADVAFRSCMQADDESLADYANRLKNLAAQAGLDGNNIDTNVVSVIYLNTKDDEIRMKCLDTDTTLAGLITWHTAHALKLATSNAIAARFNQNNGINAVNDKSWYSDSLVFVRVTFAL
jgi:hypothetical protein